MAKRKVVKSKIIEKENKRQKKLGKLLMRINITWGILAIIGIVIGGLNQYSKVVVGSVAISEGILGILLFISHIRIRKIGLVPTTDALDILIEANQISFNNPNIFKEYEEDFQNARLGHNIILVIMIIFSVLAIVVGILKLFSII